MNWKRIIIYTVVMFAATFMAGFIPGFIRGFMKAQGSDVPNWVGILQMILLPLAAFVVFVHHAFKQREKLILHAIMVFVFSTIISIINLLTGSTIIYWLVGTCIFALIGVIGTVLGHLWRIWEDRTLQVVTPQNSR